MKTRNEPYGGENAGYLRNRRPEMKSKMRVAAGAVILALLATLPLGCAQTQSLKKMDLTGQLKKLNKEVSGLNDKTASLLEVIQALDGKEAQLGESVTLLGSVDEGTKTQIKTIGELASIVRTQRGKVASVLGTGREVLSVESGLKQKTDSQLGMAGTTLDLVNALMINLNDFKNTNDGIIHKMDQALSIMRSM
jgi:septal ring factor EnvC (AmiA/AmiB activator)